MRFFYLSLVFLLLFSSSSIASEGEDFYKSLLFPIQITSYVGEDYSPAVSDDGRNLAFVSDRNGNPDIWIRSLIKGENKLPILVTRHSADDTSPAWSPDGNDIVFVSTRSDPKGDIYIVGINEKDESQRFRQLTDHGSFDSAPAWSPDGEYIAYASRKTGDRYDNVWLVNLETKQKTQLTSNGGFSPAFSPDGNYLAFISGRDRMWGNISVLRLSDNKTVLLTEGNEMDGFPAWGHEGKMIYFTRFSDDTNLDGTLSVDDRPNIWSMKFERQLFKNKKTKLSIRQLTSSKTYDLNPQASTDNFVYYTSIQKGNIDIWRLLPQGLFPAQSTLKKSLALANTICSDKSFSPYDCQLAYRNAIQDHSSSSDLKILAGLQHDLARNYQSLKNYSQAEHEYRILQKKYPDNVLYQGVSRVELVKIALERAKINDDFASVSRQGIEHLRLIIEKYHTTPIVVARAYLEIGNIYIVLKKNLKALQNYQKVIDRYPDEREAAAEATFNKNMLYLDFNNRDKLINAFLTVLEKYPDQEYWGMKAADKIIGLFDNEKGPLNKRIDSIRQIVEKYHNVPILPARAQNKIGLLYYNDNENMIAKDEYMRVLDRFPEEKDETAFAHFALAKIYFEEGEYEKSLKIYRNLEQSSFDRIDVFRESRKQFIKSSLNKGRIEFNEGEVGLALKTYRKLLDYDRTIIEAHRGLVRCYAALKKVDKIIEIYRKRVMESSSGNPAELYSLGLALTYLDGPFVDEAIKLVKKSITLNSQVSYFHQTLGWLYEQKDIEDKRGIYLEEALEEYQTALSLNDEVEYPLNEANLLLNYGNASFKLQNFNMAYKFYRMRLDTKVSFDNHKRESLFYQRFGQAAFKQGEYSEASGYFSRALVHAVREKDINRQAELNDRLALSYQEQGRYDEAVKYFSRVFSLNKETGNVKSLSIALRNIANNLFSLGEAESGPEKIQKLAKALRFYSESVDALQEYGAKERKKQKKRGLLSLQFEIGMGSDTSMAARGFDKVGEEKLIFNYLGKIYGDLRDYGKAIEYYEKKLKLTPSGLPVKGNVPVLTERSIIFNQVGTLYYKKGDVIESLNYFEKSLDLCVKLKNIHGIAVNSANIGKIEVEQFLNGTSAISSDIIESHIILLSEMLDYLDNDGVVNEPLYVVLLKNQLAVLHFHIAIDKEKSVKSTADKNLKNEDDALKVSVLNGLSIIHRETIHLKKSQDLIKSALVFLDKHRASIKEGSYYRAIVILNHNLKVIAPYIVEENRGNERPLSDINKLAEAHKFLDLQWKIQFINPDSGFKNSETKDLKEAIEGLENIPFGFSDFNDRQSLVLKQKLYDRLVFLLMQEGKVDEGLEYFERKMGMDLVIHLNNKDISFEDPVREEYSRELRKFAQELKDLSLKLQNSPPDTVEFSEMNNNFEEKQLAYKDLLENITGEDPEFGSLFKPVPPYMEEIQEILNDDEMVLILTAQNLNENLLSAPSFKNTGLISSEKIMDSPQGFDRTNKNYFIAWNITNKAFNGNVRLMEKDVSWILFKINKGWAISKEENKILSEFLLPNDIANHKRIYVVAGNGLEKIKWPLLVFRDKPLIDDNQIVHLVSLSHLLYSNDKRNLSMAAVLSVNSDVNLFNRFKNSFRSSLDFKVEEKTRRSFLNELNYYGMIHFDDGIVLMPNSPANSFINLSKKNKNFELLNSSTLFGLKKQGNLVSLNNLEKRNENEDIFSSLNFFIQSFSYAGYPSVLVELENTGQQTRQKFYRKFYDLLTQNPPSEALRLTQLEMRQENPESRLWANFRLYGYGGMNNDERGVYAESHFKDQVSAGVQLFTQKKWKEAISSFEKALVLTNFLQKDHYYERIYKTLADAAYNINDFEKAIIYEKKLVELLEKGDDPEELAGEVYFLGILYSKVEKYSASVEYLTRALNIYDKYGITDKLAEGYTTLGIVKEQSSDYPEALDAFTSSLKLQQELGEAIGEGGELRRIGRVFYKWLNQYKTAEEYFLKALKIFEAEGQKQQEIQTLLDIGLARERVGDFDSSLKYYSKAYSIGKEINDKNGLTLAALYKANSYWFQADYQKAFEHIRVSLKIANSNKNERHQVFAFNTLGLIYWTLNDLGKAKENIRKSLDLAGKINSKLDIASAYNNLGLIYRQEKKYKESIEYFQKALVIDEKIKTKWGRGYDHRNMGMSYLRLHDLDKATANIEKAVNLSGEIGNRINEAKSMLEMGNISLESKAYKKAVHYFENTHALSITINLPEVSWRALRGKGKSLWMSGEKEKALKNYKQAVEIVEGLRASIKLEEFKNGFIENKQGLYNEIVILLLELGQNEEAFNYSERGRGRSFIDLLGNHKLVFKNLSDQSLYKKIQDLKQQIYETKEALIEAENEGLAKKIKEKLTDLKSIYESLLIDLKENNPQLSSFVTVDPLKLEDVYALLDDDTLLVEYLVTEKEVIAWVVHNDRVDLARTLIEDKKLNALIKKSRLSMENLMPMDEVSSRLYDILIKPIAPFIEGAKYIGIIPHGALHYLSFASLKNDAGYFIEQQPIFYSPSASVLKYTFARRRKEKNVRVLAIGNPDLGSFNYDLPLSEMEVNSMKWNFADIDVLTRGEAKESWLLENIGNYGIIHIASHGEFDDINPLFSALKLVRDVTADGNLETNEIFSLNIKADLITLSACQTGLGQITKGDEIIGMNRAFFYAGTHSIISSLWRISDISTSILIKHFYRNYKNYDKASALRKAQLFVKKIYPHPSYWSGLVLSGDYK